LYRAGRSHGAFGGKLLGAGGGGYLFFLAPPERHDKIRTALTGLTDMPVRFVSGGSRLLESARDA
jgi:D-glycero-alpha-D-manno-heptose-7-phosphate kinase